MTTTVSGDDATPTPTRPSSSSEVEDEDTVAEE